MTTAVTHLTEEQLDDFRERLETARAQIDALLAQTAADSQAPSLDLPIGRLTRIDAIQMHGMAQMNRRQLEVRRQQVLAALAALDGGTYGLCRSCRGPIALKRLEVLPEVPFCVDCQGALRARAVDGRSSRTRRGASAATAPRRRAASPFVSTLEGTVLIRAAFALALVSAATPTCAGEPPVHRSAAEQPPPGVVQILPRGGIPAIFQPRFVGAGEARIPDEAWVLGVVVEGEAKAYSLNLLNRHEVVNDRSGGTAFAAVW